MAEYRSEFPRVKLHRPHAIAGSIERPRLLEKLDQVLEKPVALITAPAGFGKTTLLAQWLDRCTLPNAWLQLDEDIREISEFLSGVVAALRQLFPGCLQKTDDLQHAQVTVPLAAWKNALIADLELLEDTPFILALDDYHLVENPSIDLLLTDVLRYESLSLHLILTARRSPSLSFSRLKVHERVVDIRTADLRFTDSEAYTYLRQSVPVPLSIAAINQLQEKTEGWATGLALAAINLREEAQPEELITHLDGPNRQVSDYLLDQAFTNQPDEIREFLLQTAIFNQFCASFLYEVVGSKQSEGEIQALLERIEDAQLFLIPLDSQRSWYRYHHLFRQMLLSHQRFYYHPDQIALYHRRAAAWLIRHGQVDVALGHLIAVDDWVGVAQIVESQFCSMLNAEDYPSIKHSLGYFSEDFIATRPGLLLMQAWMAHLGLRLGQMFSLTTRIQVMLDTALQQNETAESDAPLPGFEIIPYRTIQANVWGLNSVILYLTNQGSQAVSLARQAVDTMPETWLFTRGNAMIYLGLSMFMEGQYHQTVELFTQAYMSLQNPGTTYGARLLFCLAVCHLLQGELELCRQTAELLVRNSLAFNLLLNLSWGYYLLGRVYQEWNQLELAAGYYKLEIDQGFTSNLFCSLESIAGYVFMLETLGRHGLAHQSLDSLQQLFSEQIAATPQPLMALTAWLKLQDGNRVEARRWAESFYAPIAEQAIVWYHIPHIYKVKILMDSGRPETSQVVDELLDELLKLAERTHNNFTLLRVLSMRGVWLARQGDRAAAQQTLTRALRLGRLGGFIHVFVLRGPEMLELLNAVLLQLKNEPDMEEYIAAIIAAFLMPIDPHQAPPDLKEIKTLLTERELEVLELLAERLSINEISARLYISPSTVQQHTHHIYRKLNATNKRQAVARAIELSILTSSR
jgi:LuxR family transcriptional regulator, maltose regulon positive regulatory protein